MNYWIYRVLVVRFWFPRLQTLSYWNERLFHNILIFDKLKNCCLTSFYVP